jgi:NADH dehydrogenase
MPAKAVTCGYHLLALPGNRTRVTADWALNAMLPRQTVQLGVIPAPAVPLDTTSPELPAWRR